MFHVKQLVVVLKICFTRNIFITTIYRYSINYGCSPEYIIIFLMIVTLSSSKECGIILKTYVSLTGNIHVSGSLILPSGQNATYL